MQLATFDLTMMQFQVLALDREGPQYQQLLSAKFRRSKQSVGFVLERLKKLGAVRRDWCRLPAASDRVELGLERGAGKNWQGRPISLVTITPAGKKLIGGVIKKHKKSGEGVDEGARRAGAGDAGAVVLEAAARGHCEICERYPDEFYEE